MSGTVLRHGTVVAIDNPAMAAVVVAAFTAPGRAPLTVQGSPLGFYSGLNQFGLPQAEWADGVNDWSTDLDSSGNWRLMRTNVAEGLVVGYSGGKVRFTFKGEVNFAGATPNTQAATAGAYIGSGGGAAVELANGTTNWRIDNPSGTLRFLRAGVQSNFEVDGSGHTKIRGGLALFNGTPITSKPTVTGSRGGNAALASVLTALASYGIIADTSTA